MSSNDSLVKPSSIVIVKSIQAKSKTFKFVKYFQLLVIDSQPLSPNSGLSILAISSNTSEINFFYFVYIFYILINYII